MKNGDLDIFVSCKKDNPLLKLTLQKKYLKEKSLKDGATAMSYFTTSKFLESLVHTQNWLDMLSSFQVNIPNVKGGRIPFLGLNELGEKSDTTIIFGKFVNKP